MSFNSERIINEIHESVEKMIGQVNKKATADQMEREIFRMVLQLGAQLLAALKSQAGTGKGPPPVDQSDFNCRAFGRSEPDPA